MLLQKLTTRGMKMKASDNLSIWNAVSTTDPDSTKKVTQRGGFTAIDAYSQIHAATAQFGPVGKGWGWRILSMTEHGNTLVVRIWFWHGNEESGFEVCGQKSLMSGQKQDEDCAKKALTDAITKALSYLGFNADVFLGKFDDNKYVEGLKDAKITHLKAAIKDLWAKVRGEAKEGNACNVDQLDDLLIEYSGDLDAAKLNPKLRDWLHGVEDHEGLFDCVERRRKELAANPDNPSSYQDR